jgi:hypothetical protein
LCHLQLSLFRNNFPHLADETLFAGIVDENTSMAVYSFSRLY